MFAKRMIWHDPVVESEENQGYKARFEKEGWTVTTRTDVLSTVQLLEQSSLVGPVFVMTSGTNGEALVQQTHDHYKVGAFVVFCRTKSYHEPWAAKYAKVKSVLTTATDIAKVCEELTAAWLAMDVLQAVDDVAAGAIGGVLAAQMHGEVVGQALSANYCPINTDLAISFVSILKTLRSSKIPAKDVKDELRKIVPHGKLSKFDEAWDAPTWKRAPLLPDVAPTSLGQKMCLGYTSNYFYRELNNKLAASRFAETRFFLGAFAQEVDGKASLQYTGPKVYRGVRKECINATDYGPGCKFYWPNYVSTGKTDAAPKNFAGGDGYVFVLERYMHAMHPHVDIDANPTWGHYGSGEKEVLLFPFVYCEVIRHEKQAERTFIYLKELPSVYNKSQTEIRGLINSWIRERLEPRIREIFVGTGPDCVNMKIQNAITISGYFRQEFGHDYNEFFHDYVRRHRPDTSFGGGLWNVASGGSGVRAYIEELMSHIKGKIPPSIERRLKNALEREVKEGMKKIHQIVEAEITSALPQIPLHDVMETLGNSLTGQMMTQVGGPEAQQRALLMALGPLGLLLAAIFSPQLFLQMGGDAITLTEEGIKKRAYDQGLAKLTEAIRSAEVQRQIHEADKDVNNNFNKLLSQQAQAATEAVEKALAKILS